VTLRHWPISAFYRRLAPWMLTGFLVMFASGSLLFTGFAVSAYQNVFFRVKMSAMLLAGINALVFHFVTERRIGEWDAGGTAVGSRIAGGISVGVWTTVIIAGRMMAYTMY